MWNTITTQTDIDNFMCAFGYFHDSCIKEIRYVSGAYVNNDLLMNPINDKRTVEIVFQRQYNNPMAIAMKCDGLKTMHLAPYDSRFTCEINGATLFMKDGFIFWVDRPGADEDIRNFEGTWLCSSKMQWCAVDDCIGNDEVYSAKY